jgi:hypothetical protein
MNAAMSDIFMDACSRLVPWRLPSRGSLCAAGLSNIWTHFFCLSRPESEQGEKTDVLPNQSRKYFGPL